MDPRKAQEILAISPTATAEEVNNAVFQQGKVWQDLLAKGENEKANNGLDLLKQAYECLRIKDYYQILGIARDAQENDIKKAYRKLVLIYHPDKSANNPGAEIIFKNILEAYNCLIDSDKRQQYDNPFSGPVHGVQPQKTKTLADFQTLVDSPTTDSSRAIDFLYLNPHLLIVRSLPTAFDILAQKNPNWVYPLIEIVETLITHKKIKLEEFQDLTYLSTPDGPLPQRLMQYGCDSNVLYWTFKKMYWALPHDPSIYFSNLWLNTDLEGKYKNSEEGKNYYLKSLASLFEATCDINSPTTPNDFRQRTVLHFMQKFGSEKLVEFPDIHPSIFYAALAEEARMSLDHSKLFSDISQSIAKRQIENLTPREARNMIFAVSNLRSFAKHYLGEDKYNAFISTQIHPILNTADLVRKSKLNLYQDRGIIEQQIDPSMSAADKINLLKQSFSVTFTGNFMGILDDFIRIHLSTEPRLKILKEVEAYCRTRVEDGLDRVLTENEKNYMENVHLKLLKQSIEAEEILEKQAELLRLQEKIKHFTTTLKAIPLDPNNPYGSEKLTQLQMAATLLNSQPMDAKAQSELSKLEKDFQLFSSRDTQLSSLLKIIHLLPEKAPGVPDLELASLKDLAKQAYTEAFDPKTLLSAYQAFSQSKEGQALLGTVLFDAGRRHYLAHEYSQAFPYLSQAAEMNHGEALLFCARTAIILADDDPLFESTVFSPQKAKFLDYLHKAAALNYDLAKYDLVRYYMEEKYGLQQNPKLTYALAQSINPGNLSSRQQNNLGNLLLSLENAIQLLNATPSSLPDKNIKGYSPKPNDYTLLDKNTNAGIAEIQGKRPNQEDQLKVAVLEQFQTLDSKTQNEILESTLAEMQATYGAAASGSTACIATAWLDEHNKLHAKTANLGDSTAFIVILDKNGNAVRTERLNKLLHDPKDPSEAERIRKGGGFVLGGRVDGKLAVSRSIGDADILTRAGDHLPDIDTLELNLVAGEKAFIVVACDGLTEKAAVNNDRIGELISKHHANPEVAAHQLVKEAFEKGSGDNISVAVVPVSTKATSAAIFDGHGGDEVSNALGANFYNVLNRKIQEQVKAMVLSKPHTDDEKIEIIKRYLSKYLNLDFYNDRQLSKDSVTSDFFSIEFKNEDLKNQFMAHFIPANGFDDPANYTFPGGNNKEILIRFNHNQQVDNFVKLALSKDPGLITERPLAPELGLLQTNLIADLKSHFNKVNTADIRTRPDGTIQIFDHPKLKEDLGKLEADLGLDLSYSFKRTRDSTEPVKDYIAISPAHFQICLQILNPLAKNYDQELLAHQAAASKGDRFTAYHLGIIYERGLGTAPDVGTASLYYRKALELGLDNLTAKLKDLQTGFPTDPLVTFHCMLALPETERSDALKAAFNKVMTDNLTSPPNSALDQALAQEDWKKIEPLLDPAIKQAIEDRLDTLSLDVSVQEEEEEEETPTLSATGSGALSISIGVNKRKSLINNPNNIAAELMSYAKLSDHYNHWSHLAEGSWGEMEKLGQIKMNCRSLYRELMKKEFETFDGRDEILQSLKATNQRLERLQTKGPSKTYLFCDDSPPVAQMEAELKSITNRDVKLDHLRDCVMGSVSSAASKSAFIQGIRIADGVSVSEAYITRSLNADKNKLREFVFDQIESFHADPNNLGKNISFSGKFTKEYLIQAINYCNLRGYAWELDSTLKDNLLSKAAIYQKDDLTKLFNGQPNKAYEQEWKTWLVDNNKHPFSKLLDPETVKDHERTLKLTPLAGKDKIDARACYTLLQREAQKPHNRQLVNNSAPIERAETTPTKPLSKSPLPSITISKTKITEEEKEEVHASLGMVPKGRSA